MSDVIGKPGLIRRFVPAIFAGLGMVVVLAGCAGPVRRSSSPVRIAGGEPWVSGDLRGTTVRTPRYAIHTTLDDRQYIARLAAVMEAAYDRYLALAPVTPSERPLECYIFRDRREWADFTARKTGEDAKVYLLINRGGYTVYDWFVAYHIGDLGTYAVIAHEGWHQFTARHFKSRLPPFLEEGIASTFETARYANGRVTWGSPGDSARAQRLRAASDAGMLSPLRELLGRHAGEIVGDGPAAVEAFYSQAWAFVQFLQTGANGRHRPGFQRILEDAMEGRLNSPGAKVPVAWQPSQTVELLESRLGTSIEQLEADYGQFVQELTRGSRLADPSDATPRTRRRG
jgi:hypothetical protein